MTKISLSALRDLWQKVSDWADGTSTYKPKVEAQITGTLLTEQLTEADAVSGVLTFAENIIAIEIYNRDTVNDGTFIVNGLSIVVPKGEVFESSVAGTPSTNVSVTGSTSYIVSRYI